LCALPGSWWTDAAAVGGKHAFCCVVSSFFVIWIFPCEAFFVCFFLLLYLYFVQVAVLWKEQVSLAVSYCRVRE
jgi:hypothetical protein